jgi:hypothetical protein
MLQTHSLLKKSRAISISLRTIRDILDENKPMDHNCFNMTVWIVACNIA